MHYDLAISAMHGSSVSQPLQGEGPFERFVEICEESLLLNGGG